MIRVGEGSKMMPGRSSERTSSSCGARVAATAILVVASLSLGVSSASAQSQELIARAEAEGTVRVIVTVRAPFAPEGRLTPPAAQNQRRGIARAQNRVLARMQAQGATSRRRFRSIPFVAMEVDTSALLALASDPDVLSVDEDVPVPALGSFEENDLGSAQNLTTSTSILNAPLAWAAGFTGTGQVVAILDTGVQKTHPFLAGKVVSEACYSSNYSPLASSTVCPGGVESSTSSGSGVNCDLAVAGCDHGTHVAGIAGGTGSSFSGVGRGAGLIAIQVFSRFDNPSYCGSRPCALSWTSDQIDGLERVLALSSTFDIASVNMSLGGGRYFSQSVCDVDNAGVKAAIDNLKSVGIATVIASGNDGYQDSMGAPGCISSAVSVGSTNFDDSISWFSNQAPFLSLYAPGLGITSSVPYDAYATKAGTSMATPHIAGAWAVLRQRAPVATVDDILAALQTTGKPITSTPGTWTTARPRLDLALGSLGDFEMAVETPQPNATVGASLTVTGWALDTASGAGSGIDRVEVRAIPVSGPTVFLGAATLGISRPDVAAIYGAQFANSGFALNLASSPLPNGTYTLEISARTVVTGSFDLVEQVPIRVLLPAPAMAVESPVNSATLPWPLSISGWAVHTGASSGTGVDIVHVWAFPHSGAPGTFLGSAALGILRLDIATMFGDARFGPSGFALTSSATLAPGGYLLVVYARSTVTGTFDNYTSLNVTVKSRILANLDTPANGAFVSLPFRVAGWSFNTAAPGTAGVNVVRVEAFPQSGGAPVLLGMAALGMDRPDVGTYFGNAALNPSGFELEVKSGLPNGSYTLRVSIRNALTGLYETTLQRSISVGPATRIAMDTPANGATVASSFVVAGWALDLAAPTGTGVDFVHVWAYPLNGSPATFLGSATLGISRPDVGAFFGSSRFNASGYRLDPRPPLPAGSYWIVAYARSTVSGTFNAQSVATVSIP